MFATTTTVTMNLDQAIPNPSRPAHSHIRQAWYTADKPHHLCFKDFCCTMRFHLPYQTHNLA